MRRLFTISFLLLFTVFAGISQNTPKTDSVTNHWGISLYGSADYNMYMVQGTTPAGQDAGFMKNIDLPRIGYTIGASVNRPVGKRVSMEFGVQLQSQGYRSKNLIDTLWNYRDSAIGFSDYEKAYRYFSVAIPVMVKIKLFDMGKAHLDLGLGVAPVLSAGKQQALFFDDHTEILNEKSGTAINVQALGCLSFYIPMGNKMSLTLEPTFRYNILPYKDSYYIGVKRNLFSAGLGIYITRKVTDDEMYDYFYRRIYKVKNLPPAF
ncbi:MAG TPA: hypothetical protein PLI16_00420 [Bacteroidales bacterium]|nr:hypothetical protein [Bacteroidales bacterium]HOH83051.1 hypothetical protein [Bacteroidales bacterium]HPB24605.1 hypothetical protein [Bacteroidales bacterium]HQP15054.1 hypothetical protein [Bacteroidales bacterium]